MYYFWQNVYFLQKNDEDIFSFFLINFFVLLIFFLQQHKNIIKSNNKKNNHMNQLLRLPLLKYTRTEKIYMWKIRTKIIIIKRKTVPSSLPRKKKDSYNTPDGGPHGNSQGIRAVTVVAKTSTPEVVAILHFLHFYVSTT